MTERGPAATRDADRIADGRPGAIASATSRRPFESPAVAWRCHRSSRFVGAREIPGLVL